MGEPATAKGEALRQIIETQPGSESAARARFELGGLQLENGHVEAATVSFRQVAPSWPRWHSRAGLEIARIYDRHLQDLDAASREYRKVIRLHPESMGAAESYVRLSEIYEHFGDEVSAENMLECAVRTYDRLITTSTDPGERDHALKRFVAGSRRLQRWDRVTEVLVRLRREAVRRRDVPRRVELDRILGHVYLDREQHGNALIRFRSCLQHARKGSHLVSIVVLTARVAHCQAATGDAIGERRTWLSLVEYVGRSPARRAEVLRDSEMAPVLARAWMALGRLGDLRRARANLRRSRAAEARAALHLIEAEMAEEGVA